MLALSRYQGTFVGLRVGDALGAPVEGRAGYTALVTLQMAVACVENCPDFSCATLTAVNFGGDTDTYGAVTGALSGALFGLDIAN